MRIFCLVFFCLYSVHYIAAQSVKLDDRKFSRTQAREDLSALIDAMKEAQTGLYRYIFPTSINKAFKQTLKDVRDSTSYQEIFRKATALISRTGCSHSGVSHTPDHEEALENMRVFFPYKLFISKGRYYISRQVYNDSTVKDRTRLLSVNGIKISRISKLLSRYIDREAEINTHLYREMEHDFAGMYANFIDRPPNFRLKIIPPEHKRSIELIIPAKTKKEFKPVFRGEPLTFNYIDSVSTGRYTITSFNEYYIKSKDQDFKAFTDEVFMQLNKAGAKKLVIDLRGNRGGSTAYSKYLLSYFIDRPVTYIESIVTKKAGRYSFSSLLTAPTPYADSMRFEPTKDGMFRWVNNPNLEAAPHPGNRFTGDIYILIDGNSMSASIIFCSAMQLHTNAKFAGEESGGAAGGLNGLPVFFQLPNSKIDIKLSTASYFIRSKGKPTRGIMPLISLPTSVSYANAWSFLFP